MDFRRLGQTDIQVSVVGIGGWALGADPAVWGPVDDNESIAAVQRGLDLGINLIDTSPTFGRGHSEEIVGKAIAGRRDRVVLATKCGLVPRNGANTYQRCLKPESIRTECEASLRRLRVETIDLYQIQRPDPAVSLPETLGALRQLQEQGKIRAIGLCNFGCERLAEARRCAPIASLQVELSLLARQSMEDLIPYCSEFGISVLACTPLARGLLTGKFDASSRPADLRAGDSRFTGDAFVRNLNLVERLADLARGLGCSPAQLALSWAVRQIGVTAALAGVKRISQVQDNTAAGTTTLASSTLEEIDRILSERS